MLTNCSQCGATISPSGGLCCGCSAEITKERDELQAEVDRLKRHLRCVIRSVGARSSAPARVPLWVAVGDICGLGSRSATELCEQLGFDSDAMTGKTFSIHGEKQKGGGQ